VRKIGREREELQIQEGRNKRVNTKGESWKIRRAM
jgi:hypothetical protein